MLFSVDEEKYMKIKEEPSPLHINGRMLPQITVATPSKDDLFSAVALNNELEDHQTDDNPFDVDIDAEEIVEELEEGSSSRTLGERMDTMYANDTDMESAVRTESDDSFDTIDDSLCESIEEENNKETVADVYFTEKTEEFDLHTMVEQLEGWFDVDVHLDQGRMVIKR